ncbi:hypothetical protein [Polaromonas sp. SM01]|uniref:hypothetical protein n=1 Tax=Polaromonas sp. SM01 TaxID=3085630 RepID=UPI0029820F3B|nr:hypothetical protein [Polaromonas sp. SM01]MDW5442609.1 hypothetical protein [Polaromonas sp. SM01]
MNGITPVCARQDQQTSAKRRQRKPHTIMLAGDTGFVWAESGMVYRCALKKPAVVRRIWAVLVSVEEMK